MNTNDPDSLSKEVSEPISNHNESRTAALIAIAADWHDRNQKPIRFSFTVGIPTMFIAMFYKAISAACAYVFARLG